MGRQILESGPLTRNFAAGLFDSLVDLVEQLLVMVLLLIPVLLLVASLIAVLQKDAALDAVVEDELVDNILRLEAPLLPPELGQVVRCLRVVRGEHLEEHLVALLRRQILLIVARHVVVVLAEEVFVVGKIVVVVFFDLSAGWALLGGASARWHSLLSGFRLKFKLLIECATPHLYWQL